MSNLTKLNSELEKAFGIEQSDFDRLKTIEVKNVHNLPLTCLATLIAFKEKKRRGQSLSVEIQLPNRGGLDL